VHYDRTLLLTVFFLVGATGAEATKPRPERPERSVVGHAESVAIVPDLSQSAAVGHERIWSHVLESKGASFVKVHLVDVSLREGDVLRIYSASGRRIEEIRDRGPKDRGSFWSLSAFGERATLEFSFSSPYARAPFSVDRVMFGDEKLLAPGPDNEGGPEDICAPADFEDVICYQDDTEKWENVLASVGVMTIGGDADTAQFCSGSNVSPDNYILTNEHCISNQNECDNSEFVFRHFRTGCNDGSQPTDEWQSFRCGEIVATSPFITCEHGLGDLDFALASVIGDPSSTFGSVEIDADPIVSGEDLYIVQHPDGRPHEITHGGGSDVLVEGPIIRYTNTLDTEGGSSGSPIFREGDDRLVGLHHCGGCNTEFGNRGMLMSDIYPAIADFVCTTDITLRALEIQDLAEIDGNGDTVLDPGETWSFIPRVRNSACEAIAVNVTAEVAINPASDGLATLSNEQVAFGDVAPGAVVAAAVPVVFTVDTGAPCGSDILLDLVNVTSDNGPAPVDFPVFAQQNIGVRPTTTLLFQGFDNPVGWTVVDGGAGTGPAETWTNENPGNRELGLTAPFTISDSDQLGLGGEMDEELISPPIDTTGFAEVTLQFSHNFTWYSGGQDEQADVDIRTASDQPWINVANFSGATSIGTVQLDISDVAAGATELQVRFHYYNAAYEWWWAVDDVFVLGSNGFICDIEQIGPELEITTAACPGPLQVDIANLTPLGPVAIGISDTTDGTTVPNGNCAGVEIEIGTPLVIEVVNANSEGNLSRMFNATEPSCPRVVQALDLTTCEASDVVPVFP